MALLAAALASTMVAASRPVWPLSRATFDAVAVIDITRSMNVRDYTWAGQPVSRLAFVKAALADALPRLPCGSRLGLGLFTERRAALLFRPIEVCQGHAVLRAAIEAIDWRMAWDADSRIADGLYDGLKLMADGGADLIFLTDGQEAPPRNLRYRLPYADLRGKVRGAVLGVGGLTPSPIPKFDEKGEAAGFYGPDEVPHQARFGLPEKAPEETEGYHARNAPFGNAFETGSEHLSSLKEDYLRELANEAGLGYRRLTRADDLLDELRHPVRARTQTMATDIGWLFAVLALIALTAAYLADARTVSSRKRFHPHLR
jgi:mxaL protein